MLTRPNPQISAAQASSRMTARLRTVAFLTTIAITAAAPAVIAQTVVGASPTAGISLKAVHSGKCLDIPGASQASGLQVIQFTCNTGYANQMFIEEIVSKPWVMYVAGHSGQCLQVSEDGMRPGAAIVQDPCDPNNRNQWFRRLRGYTDVHFQ